MNGFRGVLLTALLAAFFALSVCSDTIYAEDLPVTREEALGWAHSQMGQYIDVDGAYGAQCVDLIYAYYDYLGIGRRGGNGADYQNDDKLPEEWIRLYAQDGAVPQPGDVVVWGGYAPGVYTADGHVGLVDAVDQAGNFSVLEQNYGADRSVTLNTHKAGEFTCILRPNWDLMQSLKNDISELVKCAFARYDDM